MRRNRTIILSVIFLVLGAYVYLFESGGREKTEPSDETPKILYFDPGAVEEIKLKTTKTHLWFKKKENQWYVQSPVHEKAVSERVDSVLSVFDYGFIRELDISEPDLSQYGLDFPEIEFAVRLAGEDDFKTLLVGDTSPYGINCYAKLKESPRIYIIGILVKQELSRNLVYFTSR